MDDSLTHHGILGMKWGVRRYQNPDGTRTPAGKRREEKRDLRWMKNKGDKVTSKTAQAVRRDMRDYQKTELLDTQMYNSNRKLSKTYINQYNRQLAKLMNERVGDVAAPSGKVLRFIAKRGEVGVHTALADVEYNMQQVRNGVNASGKVAYKSDTIKQLKHSELMHYGVKGMKWGVRRTPEELGHREKAVEKSDKSDIIKKTVSGHSPTPRRAEANAVYDHVSHDGTIDIRSFYTDEGWKGKDIHTSDHKNPKQHPMGAHVIEYTWYDNGHLDKKHMRELTERERKENKDIL